MLVALPSITSRISASGVNSDVKCQLSLKPNYARRYYWQGGLAVVALDGIIILNPDQSIHAEHT